MDLNSKKSSFDSSLECPLCFLSEKEDTEENKSHESIVSFFFWWKVQFANTLYVNILNLKAF